MKKIKRLKLSQIEKITFLWLTNLFSLSQIGRMFEMSKEGVRKIIKQYLRK